MDDQKFRTLEDSINGVKDSCSKDISEIRTMLQEVVGKLATLEPQTKIPTMDVRRHRHDTDAVREPGPGPPSIHHKPTPVELGRFHGENPEAWIFQAERYFEFYCITENHKLPLTSFYLDGEALE